MLQMTHLVRAHACTIKWQKYNFFLKTAIGMLKNLYYLWFQNIYLQ